MSEFKINKTRIQAGIWEGIVDNIGPNTEHVPKLECVHDDSPIPSVSLTPIQETSGQWHLRIAIPPHVLADGIQVFLVRDVDADETLAAFTILTDEHFDEGLRQEVALLRAELDVLKRTVRRMGIENDS